MTKPFTINKSETAYLLDVSERSLTNWQNDPASGFPVKKSGKRGQGNEYDPQEVLKWFMRRRLAELTVGDDGQVYDYERERARLTREQADNTALKNAQLRRELAPVQVLEVALGKIGAQIASILQTIPGNLKKRLPALTSAEIDIAKREITKAQNIAAKVTLDLDDIAPDA